LGLRVQDGGVHMGQAKQERRGIVHRNGLLDSIEQICLFATRGSPQRMAKDVSQVILSPVGEHSAKPQEARRRIERLLLGPYLELFARSPADGWVTWGNEINQTVVRVPHAAFRQPGRDWSRTRPAAINGAPGSATPRPAFCHDSTLTPNPASSGASK
jgi:MT-A70